MGFLGFIFGKLINVVYAQGSFNPLVGEETCYLTGGFDAPLPKAPYIQFLESDNIITKVFFFVFSPLLSLLLSVRNAVYLLKKQDFSVRYAIYISFFRVIILTVILSLLASIIFFVFGTGYDLMLDNPSSSALLILGSQFIIICLSTGIGYLLFAIKNLKFLKLALAYIFILPSVVVFMVLIAMKIIPALNRYLPQDAVSLKRSILKKKLVNEGKIPLDADK